MLDEVPSTDWLASNRSAYAFRDPVRGHIVVVPRRVVRSWWQAAPDEQADLLELVREVQRVLDPSGGQRAHIGFDEGDDVERLRIEVVPRPARSRDVEQDGARQAVVGLVDGSDGASLRLELLRAMINPSFDRMDLLVSFIMKSGLRLILPKLAQAIERGARARVLTTDYLQVTDADALAQLLDLAEAAQEFDGSLEMRLFSDPLTSFHPKAYLFSSTTSSDARGFVGSSNLSLSGIETGVEWSLSTDLVGPMLRSFDLLWSDVRTQPVDHQFLRDYRARWKPTAGHAVEVGIETEPPAEAPEPRPIQLEALLALEETRAEGFGAGLVVMATGLGKTWLAAFDSARPEFGRALFVAHREEILRQSRDVFRRVRPDAELGLYFGGEKQPDADVVFASVQTLVRHLDEFDPDEFDYLVVDEFHHAAASSYRKVLDHFRPAFLLGLTATPDRMDGADLLALCGDNVVFECGLVEGIDRDELVPFRYWGIKDVADYVGIPWRNGRFDPAALAERIETRQRAQQAFDEWSDKCGDRTLGFCASIGHADFMARFFTDRDVRAVAVHSMPGSADRAASLDALSSGAVDVVFAVDMFNEGIDVPEVDSVLMLRPTESPVVFLQQLGRGLRLSEGKTHLRVVDFVGNHRSFLLHPRTLLGLAGDEVTSNAKLLRALDTNEWELPSGCSVVFDLEAIDLLRDLATRRPALGDALESFCLDYESEHEARPTAGQAQRSGLNPAAARTRDGSWFRFLQRLELLGDAEVAVLQRCGSVLDRIETEPITKSYKLVTLRAMLAAGTLRRGSSVGEVSGDAHRLVAADPRLVEDCRGKGLPDPAQASLREWSSFWRRMPLEHLANEKGGEPLFRLDATRFVPTFEVPDELGDAFDAMVAELVEWRLADYLLKSGTPSGSMRCRVSHAGGTPIVFLDRARFPDLPVGDEAFTANDDRFVGRWVKVALNVATKASSEVNELPGLLRGWFGPSAGHPGTSHAVIVEHDADTGWRMRPERADGGNPLASFVGQRFKRQQVPPLLGHVFNPGNWNSGHVSLDSDVVLFVTLSKSTDMTHGSEYHDTFESPDVFVWSSQTSTSPESKKGREILDAKANGTRIHLFTRERKTDVAFEYRGLVTPIDHERSRPMSVRFRVGS